MPRSTRSDTCASFSRPAADYDGLYVILLAPLANGQIGPAVIDGVVQCRINVKRESDPCAELKAGDATCLQSGRDGSALILWKESGTGTKLAVVRIGQGVRFRVFELKTSLSPGAVATAYVRYELSLAFDTTDTSDTFTVWDYVGDR
jgi:hypothetical protein